MTDGGAAAVGGLITAGGGSGGGGAGGSGSGSGSGSGGGAGGDAGAVICFDAEPESGRGIDSETRRMELLLAALTITDVPRQPPRLPHPTTRPLTGRFRLAEGRAVDGSSLTGTS